MKRLVKNSLSLVIALLLILGLGGGFIAIQIANAAEDTSKTFRFQILPEFSINGNTNALLSTPEEAIGVQRVTGVYGGPPPTKILEAWKNIAFHVYDENGKLVETTKGVVGDKDRWTGAKYLGPYPLGKAYTIKVDTTTLPAGYHSYFEAISSGDSPNTGGLAYLMSVPKDGLSATMAADNTNPVAETRFHVDMVSIAYVKDAETAKNLFTLENGKVTGINPQYKAGKDYVIKPISSDDKVVVPTKAEIKDFLLEGYRPKNFYFSFKDKKFSIAAIRSNKGAYDYLRNWEGNDGVNTFEKFKSSSLFLVTLEQDIPQVEFFTGRTQKGEKPKIITSLQVYYEHSLAQNCLSDGTCLPKDMPSAPVKDGYVFKGWNTKSNGKGASFDENTVVTKNMRVYPIYGENTPPVLEVKDATITVGDKFTLRSLITKASDDEDGADLVNQVAIEAREFAADKPGEYIIKFTLTDKNGASVVKSAKVIVNAAPKPAPQPNPKEPANPAKPAPGKGNVVPGKTPAKKQLPQTGIAGDILLGSALLATGAGICLVRKKKFIS